MQDRKTRRLLLLLAAALGLAVLVVSFTIGAERLRAARGKAAEYERQIARLELSLPSEEEILSLRDLLKTELEDRNGRFYRPDEMNPYSFGALIKKRLVSHGMSVIRYQVLETKGQSSLEFTVSGTVLSLIRFLKEVSESEKYWTISSLALTMRGGTGAMDAVFRIGYEILPAKSG